MTETLLTTPHTPNVDLSRCGSINVQRGFSARFFQAMNVKIFAGDEKVGRSILSGPERALVDWGVSEIPSWLETYHLTLLTVLWSGLNMLFGWLAANDLRWLWGV